MRMAEKKPFALRIDATTMKAIEKWAADERRKNHRGTGMEFGTRSSMG